VVLKGWADASPLKSLDRAVGAGGSCGTLAGMGVAVISAGRLVSVNMRMSRISSMVGLRGDIKQVVGGVLQQVVRGDQVELDSRINDCVMVHGWLERGGGVVPVSARWGRL